MEWRRIALFVCVSVLLAGSAIAFASVGSGGEDAPANAGASAAAVGSVPAWAERLQAKAEGLASELRVVARRFVDAFGRYEVGDLSREVRGVVRETSTPGFAKELLGAPPAPPPLGGFVGAAHIERLSVRFVSANGLRALVSGDLRRGAAPEEFGFLFVRHGGRWMASGPGQ